MSPKCEMLRLRAEHTEIARLAGRLLTLVQAPAPPPEDELTRVRAIFRDTLIFHLKCEDWILYPKLLESEDRHIVATARAFIAEMGELAAAYGTYTRRWTSHEAIVADWTAYCIDTKTLLRVLGNRMDRENNELYPLAEIERVGALAK